MQSSDRAALGDAATWFARMKGPDAEAFQGEFEQWLGADERHRLAYSHIAESFSLGKNLDREKHRVLVPTAQDRRRHRIWRIAAIVGMSLLLVAPVIYFARSSPTTTPPGDVARSQLATRIGEIRSMALADGSQVTLDTDTVLKVTFAQDRRDIWLERGRARFSVAHDGRIFVVHAAGGTVVAHGTVFDVRLEHGKASVRLIEGSIDVRLPPQGQASGVVRKVDPGQAVSFDDSHHVIAVAAVQAPEIVQATWPDALLDFDKVTLEELAAEANRYSSKHLVIADPELQFRRISGTFRVGNNDRLAERIASLLDAEIDHSPGGDILLRSHSR